MASGKDMWDQSDHMVGCQIIWREIDFNRVILNIASPWLDVSFHLLSVAAKKDEVLIVSTYLAVESKKE